VRRWLPTAIVLLLLAATAVAFATTERQKLERTPFAVLHVARAFSPRHGAATIDLRFRRRHLITLQIVDPSGHVVATLARERRVEPGNVRFQWRGRGVADGVYEPKLTLDDGREFTLPTRITVDSVAPTISLVSYRPHVLRRSARPEVRIAYRVSEAAHPLVFLGGRRVVLGFAKALRASVNAPMKVNGRRLRPGRYRLQLGAVDLAGNVGPRSHVFVVRVR
jgi:hypothetical protein